MTLWGNIGIAYRMTCSLDPDRANWKITEQKPMM
jgi:hypothetical protein